MYTIHLSSGYVVYFFMQNKLFHPLLHHCTCMYCYLYVPYHKMCSIPSSNRWHEFIYSLCETEVIHTLYCSLHCAQCCTWQGINRLVYRISILLMAHRAGREMRGHLKLVASQRCAVTTVQLYLHCTPVQCTNTNGDYPTECYTVNWHTVHTEGQLKYSQCQVLIWVKLFNFKDFDIM